MKGLNNPKIDYPIKMYYYQFLKVVNSRKTYDPIPRIFYGSFAKTTDINKLGLNQGIISNSITIETNTDIDLQPSSKVVLNGKEYNVENIMINYNILSGSQYTNNPSLYIKFVQLSG